MTEHPEIDGGTAAGMLGVRGRAPARRTGLPETGASGSSRRRALPPADEISPSIAGASCTGSFFMYCFIPHVCAGLDECSFVYSVSLSDLPALSVSLSVCVNSDVHVRVHKGTRGSCGCFNDQTNRSNPTRGPGGQFVHGEGVCCLPAPTCPSYQSRLAGTLTLGRPLLLCSALATPLTRPPSPSE